ncbi:MAG TPA: hypothetical protein VET90_05475 [Candidatus Binatus sp.]|nr:hypothetical protein [Candidatus Binatus sp.]
MTPAAGRRWSLTVAAARGRSPAEDPACDPGAFGLLAIGLMRIRVPIHKRVRTDGPEATAEE